MDVSGKIIVVTGGASGIGAALARQFAGAGAAHVACADLNLEAARAVAENIGGSGHQCDVSDETNIKALIDNVERDIGPIDIFVSNAGILCQGGLETTDAQWQNIMNINFMAHMWAARHVVPGMLARGGGYIVNVSSAAGLLSQIGSVSYSVTKHAAVSFAEWLAITHGQEGLGVSVVCPQGVDTPLLDGLDSASVAMDGLLTADEVAATTLDAVKNDRFMVLPHPEVGEYIKGKAHDYDGWIGGMQRLQNALIKGQG